MKITTKSGKHKNSWRKGKLQVLENIEIKEKVKLATLLEGYAKAPFSIATILRYRERRYSFSWIAPLYP